MKKTANLLVFTLCWLLVLQLPLAAQDNDKWDPPINPSPSEAAVAIYSVATNVEVVFFDEAVVAIEVVEENGHTVYQANGTVEKDNQLSISSTQWQKGRYTIRVMMNGQLVKQQSVRVD